MNRFSVTQRISLLLAAKALLFSGAAGANVEAIGTPNASVAMRAWGNQFTSETNIKFTYIEALEEIATSELFVGVRDLALVEYPLAASRLDKQGLVQFPLFGVAVAVVVNIPGIDSNRLRLNASALAAIYSGEITNWNDPRIADLNPDLSLPSIAIVPIAQSDGSSVTLNFTRYLAQGSEKWRHKVGLGSGLIWPLGNDQPDSVAAAQRLLEKEGALGFQPWNNVVRFNLKAVKLQNPSGHFVQPSKERFVKTFETFMAAQRGDFATPVNMDGADAWPILSVIYGQMKRVPEDVPDAMETVQMLKQALRNQYTVSDELIPVRYPEVAQELNQVQPSKNAGPPKRRGGS